jgi:hypothetical protein
VKWITALAFGAILGFVMPTAIDLRSGLWMNNWTAWGTIHPSAGSPGLLLSFPVFLGSALALRLVFNWHTR